MLQKNCIIIHGCPSAKKKNPTYNKHWLPWIKKELTARGIKTEIPLMPVPWKPNYKKNGKINLKNIKLVRILF